MGASTASTTHAGLPCPPPPTLPRELVNATRAGSPILSLMDWYCAMDQRLKPPFRCGELHDLSHPRSVLAHPSPALWV